MNAMPPGAQPLLSVRDLRTHFFNEDGVTRAVDGVSFEIAPGETLGIVGGESGCGKSVTALSVLRLLPAKLGRTVGGSISFEGRNLLEVPEDEMRSVRGNSIAMIFQEPMTSLNRCSPSATRSRSRSASIRARPARRRGRAPATCWSW